MVGSRYLAVVILLLGVSRAAQAEMIPVCVSEDETVLTQGSSTGYAERNQHYKFDRGTGQYKDELKQGLWTGVLWDATQGYLLSRFYLKFDLSVLDSHIGPGEYIGSAVLMSYYSTCNDHNADIDKPHNLYFVGNDAWSEAPNEFPPLLTVDPADGITWNNRPLPNPTGTPLGVFNPGSSGLQAWDITSTVVTEHSGDQELSLLFKAADESFDEDNKNAECFTEWEEDISGCCQFVICVDVVPSPSVFMGLLSMGATGALVLAWRRWRRIPAG